jgi:hypothetical protein
MWLLNILFYWLFGLPGVALFLSACVCLHESPSPEDLVRATQAVVAAALGALVFFAAVRKGG